MMREDTDKTYIEELSALWKRYESARVNWQEAFDRSPFTGELGDDLLNLFLDAYDAADYWGHTLRYPNSNGHNPFRPEAYSMNVFEPMPIVAIVEWQPSKGPIAEYFPMPDAFNPAPVNLIRYAYYCRDRLTPLEIERIVAALSSWLIVLHSVAQMRFLKNSSGHRANAYLDPKEKGTIGFLSDVYLSLADLVEPPQPLRIAVSSNKEYQEVVRSLNEATIPALNEWTKNYAVKTARCLLNQFSPNKHEYSGRAIVIEADEMLSAKVKETKKTANWSDDHTDPLEEFLEIEELAQLHQIAKNAAECFPLSPAEREVRELRQQGLNETGIASHLKKPIGTVRALDQKGKRKLRAAYEAYKAKREAAA